jgi:hypothetical protein
MKTNSNNNIGRKTTMFICCIFLLQFGMSIKIALASQSTDYHYHYISLSKVPLPAGFHNFTPSAINENGLIYGIVDDGINSYSAVYTHGTISVTQPEPSFIGQGAVNARGIAGGSVFTDPANFKFQAALFRGHSIKMIPYLPGETSTQVVSLNDYNSALLWSETIDPSTFGRNIYRLYSKGKYIFRFQLPTGSDCPRCWGVNNQGVVVGTISDPDLNAFRAVRFQPPYRNFQLLNPAPSDTDTTSFGINNSGNILGISYASSDPNARGHIGIWDKKGNFKTYFEDFNYIFALFNDNNLIVLTEGSFVENGDRNSYIVPKPGVRINLMDLVDNPAEASLGGLNIVTDINNRGDIVGYSFDGGELSTFLLRRVFSKD